jgi:protein-S-isoprenylcysteine O-methyltransferase Ste14
MNSAPPFLSRQVICWSATLAELAVILASQNPSLPISRNILSRLGGFSNNAPPNPNSTFLSGGPGSGSWRHIRPTSSFFLGTLMTALGGYIRWACYRALGRLFTFEMSIRDNHELVTDGPYGWVRHPAYTGILLIVAGVVLWHATEVCLNFFFFKHGIIDN